MCYLCEKYCKPIRIQYYIANYFSYLSQLTLLDLTNTLNLQTSSLNGTHSSVRDLLYFSKMN